MHRPVTPQYAKAEEELELYFAAAGGIVGLHGTGFEGSSRVWDEARCNDEHARMLVWANALEPEKLAKVAPTVSALLASNREHWLVALAVLTPRRWPERLGREMARGAQRGNLTGLLLTSGKLLARALESRPEQLVPPTALELLLFAAHKAERSDSAVRHAFFQPLRDECEERYQDAVIAYDKLREAREMRAVQALRDRRYARITKLRQAFG